MSEKTLKNALELTEQEELTEVIQQAFEKGKQRQPKTFNVVTHPTFGLGCTETQAEEQTIAWQTEYIEKIAALLNTGENIIITPSANEDPEMWEEKFITIHNSNPQYPYMGKEGIQEFLEKIDGIHPDDTFVVHGTAYHMGTTQRMMQILALLEYQIGYTDKHVKKRFPGARGYSGQLWSNPVYDMIMKDFAGKDTNVKGGIQHNYLHVTESPTIFVDPETTDIIPNPNANEIN